MDIDKMSVAQVKSWLQRANREDVEAALPLLESDKRKGIALLLAQYRRKEARAQQRMIRWDRLNEEERKLREQGFRYIAGVDEAGRGPLAGPVVAAAVILHENFKAVELNDSKQLTRLQRDELAQHIKKHALAYHVSFIDASEIDRLNIHHASLKAMVNAVQGLSISPDFLLIDAFSLSLPINQRALVKGDARSASIAAASVLAKVSRDRWMERQSELYPHYGFEQHMGYGTKVHKEAIKRYGLTPLHRRSFLQQIIKSGQMANG